LKILAEYSHLNGLEFLMARKPKLLKEIRAAVRSVNAAACRTKASLEKTKAGKIVYSPRAMNQAIKDGLRHHGGGWEQVRTKYWVCRDPDTNRQIVSLPPSEQRKAIVDAGFEPFESSNQTDFVKDRVAVEVQFGKYAFVAYDLFVKHMAFYVAGKIDLGIEIMPMKCLQKDMSSGPCYYERELHNLIREGRGVPAVPLLLIGVGP